MPHSRANQGLIVLAAYLVAGWWLFSSGLKRHVSVLFHLVQIFTIVQGLF